MIDRQVGITVSMKDIATMLNVDEDVLNDFETFIDAVLNKEAMKLNLPTGLLLSHFETANDTSIVFYGMLYEGYSVEPIEYEKLMDFIQRVLCNSVRDIEFHFDHLKRLTEQKATDKVLNNPLLEPYRDELVDQEQEDEHWQWLLNSSVEKILAVAMEIRRNNEGYAAYLEVMEQQSFETEQHLKELEMKKYQKGGEYYGR